MPHYNQKRKILMSNLPELKKFPAIYTAICNLVLLSCTLLCVNCSQPPLSHENSKIAAGSPRNLQAYSPQQNIKAFNLRADPQHLDTLAFSGPSRLQYSNAGIREIKIPTQIRGSHGADQARDTKIVSNGGTPNSYELPRSLNLSQISGLNKNLSLAFKPTLSELYQRLSNHHIGHKPVPSTVKIPEFDPVTNPTGVTYEKLNLSIKLAQSDSQAPELVSQQYQDYQKQYNISQFEQQPFCIVIPTYNNAAQNRYLRNLQSILRQNYSNYHIVLIDDGSVDGTGELVKQYAQLHNISDSKLKIIVNGQRLMAMANIHTAAKDHCKAYEIFVIVDGDDSLLGVNVLKLYNAVFQSQGLWLAYSNFLTLDGNVGYSRPYAPSVVESSLFRKAPFIISHLRAFYTKLLHLVSLEDLKDENGNWFRAANDVAIYMPLLEMSQKKLAYIPEICYFYNSNTGLNNHIEKQAEQRTNEAKIKDRMSYGELADLFTPEEVAQLHAELGRKIQMTDAVI